MADVTDKTAMDEQVELALDERSTLRRVPGLSTELQDISEVEYRQLRLERVVLVGVWTSGTAQDAENSLTDRWRGKVVPSLRRPLTSRPMPMIFLTLVAR